MISAPNAAHCAAATCPTARARPVRPAPRLCPTIVAAAAPQATDGRYVIASNRTATMCAANVISPPVPAAADWPPASGGRRAIRARKAKCPPQRIAPSNAAGTPIFNTRAVVARSGSISEPINRNRRPPPASTASRARPPNARATTVPYTMPFAPYAGRPSDSTPYTNATLAVAFSRFIAAPIANGVVMSPAPRRAANPARLIAVATCPAPSIRRYRTATSNASPSNPSPRASHGASGHSAA